MSNTDSAPLIRGSCLCRQVTYTITGQAIGSVICHCENCQKFSGSAFAHNAPFKTSQFTITKGTDSLKQYSDKDTKSGDVVLRHFCGTCGSPIYLQGEKRKGMVVVNTGSMDGGGLKDGMPKKELFPEGRRGWFGGLGGGDGKAKM